MSGLLCVAFADLILSLAIQTGLQQLRDIQAILLRELGERKAQGTAWRMRSNTLKPQTDLVSSLALKKAPRTAFLIHQESPKSQLCGLPPCSLWPETEPPQLPLLSTHAFMLVPTRKSTLLPFPPQQDLPAPASTLSVTLLILLYPFHLLGLNTL